MKRAVFLFILCLTLGVTSVNAQYSGNTEALSIRGVFPNYRFQLDNEVSLSDFTSGVQVEYAWNLNDAFNMAVPLTLARAEYPTDNLGSNFTDRLYIGMDALVQLTLFDGKKILNPSIYAGLGFNVEKFDAFNLNLPVGLVLDVKLDDYLYLSPKMEYRIGFEDNRDVLMPALGIKILLNENEVTPVENPDRDGDGVPNEQDLCPDVAGVVGLNGCPDRDGDGITDGDDACPDAPGTREMNGCPDTDGDGIADKDDECPTEFGSASNNGCPLRDSDNDGVTDDQDQCPNTPGLVALGGCPDTDSDGIIDSQDLCPRVPGTVATRGCPDTDGDLVIDSDDECPNTPGTIANNGCPELSEEDKEVLTFAAQNIQFETASATLKPESRTILDQVAEILIRNASFSVSIDGHTDSIGSAINNQRLSEQRAKTCYDYLISKGIAASRLSYQGFGESKPIADNATREGREENRRVEFNIHQ